MNTINNLRKYFPNYEDILHLVGNEHEAAYILKKGIDTVKLTKECQEHEESAFLIEALVDQCWERIHTGHFSNVALNIRKIYALANYLKIYFMLYESDALEEFVKCNEILDKAMLVGCTEDLYNGSDALKQEFVKFLDEQLELMQQSTSSLESLPILPVLQRQEYKCDVLQLDCPCVELFGKLCFQAEQPALLQNTISHWPAMKKWRNLNYLLKIAGNRTVPIEIGSNYATEEWSQQLIKFDDFLRRQFVTKSSKTNTEMEYLAQHELFGQVPALLEDIRIPDYCSLGTQMTPVDIKAWLGPSGTISPMHYDPKHNLLCQVFGMKRIILAAPSDTKKLYPHESEFLNNTSQLDAANINFEHYPLAASVKFYEVVLQEGDCLYIPPKWWHYVRGEQPSFSVSFWWE